MKRSVYDYMKTFLLCFLTCSGSIYSTRRLRKEKYVDVLLWLLLLTLGVLLGLKYEKCVIQLQKWNPYIQKSMSVPSILLYKSLSNSPIETQVIDNTSPFTVHFVWCDRNIFQFKHYLSILSGAKVTRAHKLVFHYQYYPVFDKSGYNVWFDRIQAELYHLTLQKHKSLDICGTSGRVLPEYITQLIPNGGIFISLSTVVVNFSPNLRMSSPAYDSILPSSLESSMLLIRKNTENIYSHKITCGQQPDLDEQICIRLPTSTFYPKDILHSKSGLGTFLHWCLYGSKDIPIDELPNKSVVPSIAHYVMTESSDLSLVKYLSILSSLQIASFDHVYIHGNVIPTGIWWNKLKIMKNVSFVYTPISDRILDCAFKDDDVALLLRAVFILQTYGGIFVKDDLIWIKPLRDDIWNYNFTASFGEDTAEEVWPGVFDSGFLVSSRNSEFIPFLLANVRAYCLKYTYTAGHILYRTYEDHPYSIHVTDDKVKSAVCTKSSCSIDSSSTYSTISSDKQRSTVAVFISWDVGEEPEALDLNALLQNVRQALGDIE